MISDQWFTPLEVYADIIRHFNFGQEPYRVVDPTTCLEAVEHLKAAVYLNCEFSWSDDCESLTADPFDPFDLNFCNPPYSRESGGAQKFVELLSGLAYDNLFLVNFGTWIARLEGNPRIGLVQQRIKFEPSKDLEQLLKARAAAKGKAWTNSPRYDNAFIYYGDLDSNALPTNLGGYEIRWVQ